MAAFTIQSPLLVFDQVYRKTSTIERVCILTNHQTDNIDLLIQYDFPEHSWIQIYSPEPSRQPDMDGKSLTLQPGENRLVLSFNTDNFNFPDSSFKGRIFFVDKRGPSSRQWIEICFERVQELKPFLGYAAIDLGTSTSAVAVYHIQRDAVTRMPWTPKLSGEEIDIPSVVFIGDLKKILQHAEGGFLAGSEAVAAYRLHPSRDPRCFQRSTKRLVGLPRILVTDGKGTGGYVDPMDVLYSLGKYLRAKTQSYPDVHALLKKVSVTFPPNWDYSQINRWKELFYRLGFREEELDFSLDEASAAGLFYIYNCVCERDSLNKLVQDLLDSKKEIVEEERKGKGYVLNLLCFDFGGGTIDLAFVEARLELFPQLVRLRLSLLGSDSVNFGGDQVTLTVFRILKRRVAMALSDPSRMQKELMGESKEALAQGVSPALVRGHSLFSTEEDETFVLPDAPSHALAIAGSGASRAEESEEIVRENWGYLTTHISDPWLDSGLEEAVEKLFPTRFLPSRSDPFLFDARRNFDWLWERAERVKKRLFDEMKRLHAAKCFPAFDSLEGIRSGTALKESPISAVGDRISWAEEEVCERILSVSAGEVWRALSTPLQEAVAKAKKIVGSRTVDRVLLSGQSCRMPTVSWLLSCPRSEGGLGIPPARIEFDEKNAKAGVSKGACLLHVLRETMVGFEVDVADFKANLHADIFYLEAEGTRKVLFPAGTLDDFSYIEERPDPRAFPKYLSIFCGSEKNLIGQFLFGAEGEDLRSLPAAAGKGSVPGPKLKAFPIHREVLELREKDRSRYAALVSELLRWSERERILWMEQTAANGSSARPCYRYYLTRNHNLFAIRDAGPASKNLFTLQSGEEAKYGLDPREDPFSGVH